MSDTDKLLRALCDALGYEIEEIRPIESKVMTPRDAETLHKSSIRSGVNTWYYHECETVEEGMVELRREGDTEFKLKPSIATQTKRLQALLPKGVTVKFEDKRLPKA